MSPRVRAVLDLVSAMTDDERAELRGELDGADVDDATWNAAWSSELARRIEQVERGEVKLLSADEFWNDDD
jgi:hypothetical protein